MLAISYDEGEHVRSAGGLQEIRNPPELRFLPSKQYILTYKFISACKAAVNYISNLVASSQRGFKIREPDKLD